MNYFYWGITYFMTFIDDFSHRTWVYFLKNKFEAFDKFLEFKAQAEKECGHYIKVLRSYRGGEYSSNSFVNFYRNHDIKKDLIASYTPQQNGVAERKNRTIVEMARRMMKEKGLPHCLLSRKNLQPIILHSKMECLRERAGSLFKWQEA